MMNKVTTALKVNILSLLCIPIFLLSLFFYMLGTAVRKINIIIISVFAFMAVILIDAIISNPSEILSMIILLVIIFVIVGAIIAVIIACISLVSEILVQISKGLSFVFIAVGDFLKERFISLLDQIRGTMESAEGRGKNKGFMLACFMFFIMDGLYHAIIKILKYSHIYAGIGCISILVVVYFKFSSVIMDVMGISLIRYVKLFSFLDILSCALILITLIACAFVIIVSFGFEWRELAISIEQGGSYRYINSCFDTVDEEIELNFDMLQDRFSQAGNYRLSVMQKAQEIFNQNIGTRELERAFNENNSKWAENLDKISKYIEDAYEGSNLEKQRTLYWRIEYLLIELENVNRNVEDEINEAVRKSSGNQYEKNKESGQKKSKNFDIHFFMGCKDLNSLEERRKKLAKIYHPDTETGDTESFQVMMNEYEDLKKSFSMNV